MAVDGHQRSVPIRMRPRAVRSGTDQDQGATRTTARADGGKCRSDPRSPGLTVSGSWTPSPGKCWSPPTAPVRCTPSRPWTITATGIRVTRTRPTKARGLRTAAQLLTVQRSAASTAVLANAAAPRRSGGSGYRPPEAGLPGYHVPEIRDSARSGHAGPGYQPQGFVPPSGGQEIWPVTGAQEALPDTGPQPIAQPIAPIGRGCPGLRPLPAGSQPGLPGSVVRQPAPERPGSR